eukprot:TRINITY_DN25784_c0_g1_i4.p5 TRINITY_DN25784_c0_g1~~TRINITY_DN25784_c0_g1_i4.p5  ORF type:complete len:112 (+),score=5.45 TRINITY_DN25784_c0_g1_i4:206-541(+)
MEVMTGEVIYWMLGMTFLMAIAFRLLELENREHEQQVKEKHFWFKKGQGRKMRGNNTHSKLVGYLAWIFGIWGAHRFYYGKPVTGIIWFFTFGLFFIGWIIDFFLILRTWE